MLAQLRRAEEERHRAALEEAAAHRARGGKVEVYTGNKGMKVMLKQPMEAEAEAKQETHLPTKMEEGGREINEGDDAVDEMGDYYYY